MIFVPIALLAFLSPVNEGMPDESRPAFDWAGTSPSYSEHFHDIHCGETELHLSFSQQPRVGVKLTESMRSPEHISDSIKAGITDLVEQFSTIEKVEFFCGSSSEDFEHENGKKFDFRGQIEILVSGIHKISSKEARLRCDELGGIFDHNTVRKAVLDVSVLKYRDQETIGGCTTAFFKFDLELDPNDGEESK